MDIRPDKYIRPPWDTYYYKRNTFIKVSVPMKLVVFMDVCYNKLMIHTVLVSSESRSLVRRVIDATY